LATNMLGITSSTARVPVARLPTRGATQPVRVEVSILKKLKIAAAMAELSVMEYCCRVLEAAADKDIEHGFREMLSTPKGGEDGKARPKK